MEVSLKRAAVACLAIMALAGEVGAQSFSPYSDFQGMSLAQLGTLQIKLTDVNEAGPTGPAVLFGASTGSFNLALFTPYRRSAFIYLADDLGPARVVITTQLLKAVIDSVATLPGVTDGNVDSAGSMSFSMLNTSGGTKAFEAVVDTANGQALVGKILQALRSNASAVNAVRTFACGIGLLPPGAPTDVTSSTSVEAGGLRFDRLNTEYAGKVKVTNTSGSALTAPVVLVMHANTPLTVQEAAGATCNIEPSGATYITLLGSGSLAPSASIETTLHVKNPSKTKLNVTYKVFAGTGTP